MRSCPANHSEFNLNRPTYNTGVSELGKRIGIIDNYKKTRTAASSYIDFLKTSSSFFHLKNNRPDIQFKPINTNAAQQDLIQVRKRNGESYLATLQGKKLMLIKQIKQLPLMEIQHTVLIKVILQIEHLDKVHYL